MISSLELGKKVIKDKIPLISRNPGVYRMISSTGEILYIGKQATQCKQEFKVWLL